jgi:hypothetical protein
MIQLNKKEKEKKNGIKGQITSGRNLGVAVGVTH